MAPAPALVGRRRIAGGLARDKGFLQPVNQRGGAVDGQAVQVANGNANRGSQGGQQFLLLAGRGGDGCPAGDGVLGVGVAGVALGVGQAGVSQLVSVVFGAVGGNFGGAGGVDLAQGPPVAVDAVLQRIGAAARRRGQAGLRSASLTVSAQLAVCVVISGNLFPVAVGGGRFGGVPYL